MTSASYNSEIIEDRYVHAARGLASIELSFHPCNIVRDSRRGVTKMWAAIRENGDFFAIAFRITGKLLKIDGYMQRDNF